MPTCHRVPGPAQIVGQILFHLCRRVEWHRIQVGIQFGQFLPRDTTISQLLLSSAYAILTTR